MKIRCSDERTLIIRPAVAPNLFLGLLLLLIGTVTLLSLSTTSRLTCERVQGTRMRCQVSKHIFGFLLQTDNIEGLRGARLERYKDSDGDITYRVILLTSSGEQALTDYKTSGPAPLRAIVDEVDAYIEDTSLPELDVSQRRGIIWWLVNAAFFIFGIGSLVDGVLARFTSWTFDRRQGVLTHRRGTLLGVKQAQYPLADVEGVHLSVDNSGEDTSYRVELQMQGGKRLPLVKHYNTRRKKQVCLMGAVEAFLEEGE